MRLKEPRDSGAIPGPATSIMQIKKKMLAQQLRKNGFSIGEIANNLDMIKSGSISKWCKDINLTAQQKDRLKKKEIIGGENGRKIFLDNLKKKDMEAEQLREEASNELGIINKRDLFIAGIAMYWSEGYKYKGGNQVGFTNSDPNMILFMLGWFQDICGISRDRITLQVKINESHKNRIKDVEVYWSEVTNIPLDQFNKSVLIKSKSKKIYDNYDNYFGTLRITIRSGGLILRKKIMGWIDGLGR